MFKCVKKYPNLFLETAIFRSFIGMRDLVRQNGLFPSDESTLLSQYKDLNNFCPIETDVHFMHSTVLKMVTKMVTKRTLLFVPISC